MLARRVPTIISQNNGILGIGLQYRGAEVGQLGGSIGESLLLKTALAYGVRPSCANIRVHRQVKAGRQVVGSDAIEHYAVGDALRGGGAARNKAHGEAVNRTAVRSGGEIESHLARIGVANGNVPWLCDIGQDGGAIYCGTRAAGQGANGDPRPPQHPRRELGER